MAYLNRQRGPLAFFLLGKVFEGLLLLGLISLAGCGGGSSSNTSGRVSVSASPSNVTVISGKTRQFTAVVSNSPNTLVIWSTTAGTVDSSGLFTAPAVSSVTQVDVTATSQADASKSATVALTVTPTATAVELTVSPTNLSFAVEVGTSDLMPASVGITNSGAGTLSFTDASDQPWLVTSAASGTAPATLGVSASIGGLKIGTYTGHVTVTSGGVAKAVTVALAVVAAPAQHSVTLSWKANASPNVVSYSMYRSNTPGSSYGLLASALDTTTYSDQGVQSGAIYYYVVTAVDNTGQESVYSNEIRAAIP
jgi:hypothetical protein